MVRPAHVALLATFACCALCAASGYTPPKPIRGILPRSTADAFNNGFSGIVLARVEVDAAGVPGLISILNPTGYGLEANTASAIHKWRFHPALRDGHPVPGVAIVEAPYGFGPDFVDQNAAAAGLEFVTGQHLLVGVEGYPHDPKTALLLFERSTELGSNDARAAMGEMYVWGDGIPADPKRGAALLKRAGNSIADFDLGRMNEYGVGVPKNLSEAVRWYRRAAAKGSAQAANSLGAIFEKGEGVRAAMREAFHWYSLAAQRGVVESQRRLGRFYVSGGPVEKNIAEAYYWFAVAGHRGDEPSAREAAHLAGSLDPSELKKIDKRVESYRPTF